MAADLAALCADLLAESAVLESICEPLDAAGWATPTPAPGWAVVDQILHLAFFDERARTAAVDPEGFRSELAAAVAEGGSVVDRVAAAQRGRTGPDALAWLRTERAALVDAARAMEPGTRVPWYGPDMTIASSVTARIMETWAHGVDVHDALGVPIVESARLSHVAFIGVRAFANSFRAHGLAVPEVSVRVVLTAADGTTREYGPADAAERIEGPLLDFCLVCVQRRHRDDTSLVATGPVADQWLSIAQAFAGPAGRGRSPGS